MKPPPTFQEESAIDHKRVEDALRKRRPDAVVDRLPITSDRIVELLTAER